MLLRKFSFGETMMWRLFTFSFLTLCPGLFASACEIEINPPSIVVRYGGSLLANCMSSCSQVEGFGWESPVGGTGLQKGASSLPLKIDKVEIWELVPQCYISAQEQLIKDLHVTVYKMPDSVSMSQESSEMVEGQQYVIKCDINDVAPVSNLSVLWHKGNMIIHTDTFNMSGSSPQNVSSQLNLNANRTDNENQIWCEAKLNLWPDEQGPPPMKSTLRRMTVHYPPTFTESANETVEVTASGNITLNCTATGNPMPTYKWNFFDPLQKEISNQQTNEPILTSSFHLQGNYSCTASNSQGSNTKYFTVIETEGSRPGTTAGILMAVFFFVIFMLTCMVYHKQTDRTTFIAIVTSLVLVGILLVIGGLYFVKQDGTFSFKGQSPSEVI